MKIVIATSGTRGDVQPYIALGLELVSRGHEVVLATEQRMKPLVEELGRGIAYAEVAGDPQGMVFEKKYQVRVPSLHTAPCSVIDKIRRTFA
jgi:UDP:flavonoid glycosyltransferase YjiC (YdhE family)